MCVQLKSWRKFTFMRIATCSLIGATVVEIDIPWKGKFICVNFNTCRYFISCLQLMLFDCAFSLLNFVLLDSKCRLNYLVQIERMQNWWFILFHVLFPWTRFVNNRDLSRWCWVGELLNLKPAFSCRLQLILTLQWM